MNTTTRTDIHSPANLNPEHYEFVLAFDAAEGARSEEAVQYRINVIAPLLAAAAAAHTAGRVAYGDATRCDHCGAHIRYVGLFRHIPTGDILAIGETCAEGRMTYSEAEFDRLRKAAALDRQAQRILIEWTDFKAQRELSVDWDALAASENDFIADVLRKGRNYGNLSDRQVDAIVKAHARDLEYAARRAAEAANALPTTPVPTGDGLTIEGKVLSTKWVENDFGCTLKMLVEVEVDGAAFKLWGSVPRAIDPERGDRVRFVGNVERSNDDEAFGFFKRPRKAVVLETAVA